MAGASDKARFYLEQSIPELQDLQRKQIFSEARFSMSHCFCPTKLKDRKKLHQLQRRDPTLSISSMPEAHSLRTTLVMRNTK